MVATGVVGVELVLEWYRLFFYVDFFADCHAVYESFGDGFVGFGGVVGGLIGGG